MSGNPRNTAPVTGNNVRLVLKFATLFMMLVAFSFSTAMAVEPEYDVQGVPVEPFVTPDGLFDIDSARAIGFEGALNLSGWSCFIDPETGEPILIQEGDTTGGAAAGKPGGIGTGFPEGAEKSADDVFWANEFGMPGFDGAIRAVAFYNGDLYVGGQFRYNDTAYIPYIARWDGTSWAKLGTGTNSSVLSLQVYNGKLIAGGYFTNAGGTSNTYRIAAWDGSSWSALGTGMNNYVWCLTVHNGDLYAGGYFTTAGGVSASRVAKWDGSSWSALGSGMNSWVYTLHSHNGELYAGGSFTTAGGVSAKKIAKWNGSAWSAVGGGMYGSWVMSLATYGGNLIAGGNFTAAGPMPASRIASWDGSSWSLLGSGMNNYVWALDVYDGELVASGNFSYAGGSPASRVATWDGSSWNAVGSGTNDIVYAVAVSGTDLVVGGNFTTAGGGRASRVARWDSSNWNSYPTTYYGKGLNNVVYALAIYDGELIAAGGITVAGTTSVASIAAWDGTDWNPLGSGMNSYVYALTVYNGSLIAGGPFTTAGGSSALRIAAWDGSSWSALGSGLNHYARTLHVHGTDMIVGGRFTSAGGSPASMIASWDGSSWSALGDGFNSYVYILETYNGELYAGGNFTLSGATSVNKIARWDGSAWNPLGSGMNAYVHALEVYNGELIAGGVFTTAGGTSAYGIAAWDGSTWSTLGLGLYNPGVFALTVRSGKLIAGGYFYRTYNSPYTYMYRIAEWDGSIWNNIGSGMNSTVYALQVKDTSLWAGGVFSTAGGKKSHYIARWDKQTGPNDPPYAQCRTVGWINLDSTCLVDTTNDNGSYDSDGDSITIVYDPPGPYGPGQHLVTLIVTDEHGLADTCQSYIYVRDVTPPTITCPPDTTVQCLADVPAVDLSQVTATDYCDPDPTVILYSSWYSGNCPKYLYRRFRAKDSTGYAVYCTQTITINDTIPPVLTCPDPVTVQCSADVPNPNIYSVSATDNCTSVTVQFVSDSTDGGSCPETIYRKYRGIDDCGNIGYCTQVITVNDTIPPVANCPPDITTGAAAGQCSKNIGFSVSGTDNCGTPTVVATPPSGSSFPIGTTQVEVVATDACGNKDTCHFNVTITDNEAPVANCPANISVGNDPGQCSAVVNFSATATDNCPGVSVVASPASGSTFPVGTTPVTVIATDASGNADTCTFNVTVNDTESPVASCPANISVGNDPGQCSAVVNFSTGATDNCPGVSVVASHASGSAFPVGTTTVTAIATDASGNADTCTFDITVNDTENPVATCPAAISVGNDPGQCSAVVNFSTGATDNCPGVSVVASPASGSAFPVGITTVTVTATDAAGNINVCAFTVTVIDTENPVATCPAAISVGNDPGQCSAVVSFSATATDNCPGGTVVASPASGSTFPVGTTPVTVTATDAAGNINVCAFTVTVNDTENPVATCPANITVGNDPGQCSAVVNFNVSATDNCPGVSVVASPASGSVFPLGATTVTVTATDAAGNTDVCTFNVTVNDIENPTANCPANITVGSDLGQCSAVVSFSVSASDNCPGVSVVASPASGSAFPIGTTTVTVTATDAAGNTDVCTFNVTVNDTENPVANCPSNISVSTDPSQCSAVVNFSVSATDNCPGVTVVASPPSGSTFPIGVNPVTVTATDASGNTNICSFNVTVNDTENPSIICPADITVQCAADVPAANPGLVVTSDNCDVAPTVTWQGDVSDGLSCPETITRTYRATDDYGNWAECTQVIVVDDTIAPTFDQACPTNVTVECDAVPTPPTLTATDNCDPSPTVTYNEDITPGVTIPCTGNYTITRTWTATDDCGNQSQCVQVITVQDTQAPVFDQPCPPSITVECDAVPAPATLTATDNCDPSPTVTYNQSITGMTCTGNYTITRTWAATDDCGNQSQCVQVITVQDTQAPIFDQPCPPSITVECDAVPAPATLTATDNCDVAPTVTYQQDSTAGACDHSYILTRTWTTADDCGNQGQCVQVVTVQDTHAPSLYGVPSDITLECSDPVPPPANPSPTDNCDPNPVVTMVEDTTAGSCPHSFTITRTWTATDDCGNQFQRTQVITIEDTTPPVFDQACPQAATVECSQLVPPAPMTATDNCDPAPDVVLNEVITPGNCTGNYTITNTWTATDACGNVATCIQVINVQDTEAPVFDQPCPASVTVECDAVPQPPTLTATDNCDASPVVTYNESTTPDSCADSYTLTRTWTATDDCGNSTQCVQVITVQDTQAPVFDQPCPADMTVDCDAIPDPPTLTASDNCDAAPQIVFESTITNGNCAYNYTITRNWYASDNCNNVAVCTQVLTVQDTTSPVCNVPNDTSIFQCVPTEICLPVSSTDNCDPDPAITLVGGPGQLVGGQWCYTALVDEVAVVTVRSTDSCGNICEATFTVDIDINEPPVVTCRADTAMFVCDLSEICLDGYSYTDPENNIASVVAVGGTTDGSSICFIPVEGANVLTFIVTDSCGEVDSCSTTVEIDLNEPPVVSCPNDTTIHWNDILIKTATFTDGDSPPQTVSFSLGAGTPDGVTINSGSGQIVWPTNGGDVCGGTIVVIATDSCGEADTCSFDVCVQNTPPSFLLDSLEWEMFCWGETATGGVEAADPDGGPSVLQYSVVSFDGPGSVSLDVNTGDWVWPTQEDDSYVGDWELCIGVTDNANLCSPCSPENADTICQIIHIDRVFEVKIEKTHQTPQGQVETVDITYESGTREMGGFNFLIDYDAGVLQFMGAVPGPAYYDPAPDGCGWEYFTYRYGPNGNCGGSACPSGKLRVVGFAETNNGANHPNCFIASSSLLLSLQFFVSNDRILECQYVPIRWCWFDCGDNAISSVSGDTLFISRGVFEFEDTLGLNSIDNPNAAFPTFFGANSTCDVSGGVDKPEPSRCGIDFWNGGIDIVCADSIDARADLNLNGIPYEVADAVLFSNYFIYGLSVFTVNVEGQVAASDVNGDGIVLSVADLVTLVRVVVGDELQAPKVTNPISADYVHRSDGVVAMKDEDMLIGAALVIVEGDATPELLAPLMDMAFAFDGERTRMLVWSPEGHSFSGSFLRVTGRIVRIEMADADGTPVVAKMIPATFALHQNFPNPFNPVTTLSFGLPTASAWELTVYNVSGRRVASWSGYDEAGTVQIKWEAGNVASGIYFYRLTAGTFIDTKKMVLLK